MMALGSEAQKHVQAARRASLRVLTVSTVAGFVATKHGAAPAPSANIFTRFTEGVEDTMRAGRLSTAAISETVGLLNKAMGVLNGVAAAGKSVASDIVTAASSAAKSATGTTTEPAAPPPASPQPTADDAQQPPIPPGL